MSRNKRIQRLMAMMLSVIMVLGMIPVLSVAETDGLPVGGQGEITAFAELAADIAAQNVPLGTSEADLELPDTLMVIVRLTVTDTVSGQVYNSEKNNNAHEEITVPLPVTWESSPKYLGDTQGEYIFTPQFPEDFTLAKDMELPSITVTVTEAGVSLLATSKMFTLLSTGSQETQVLGLGTEEYPLRIETAAQLADFAHCLNNGVLPDTLPEQPHLLLVQDIDLSAYGKNYDEGNGWSPIGTRENPFKGTFDGGNKQITGLYINQKAGFIGLFGSVNGGTVQNLTLRDVNIIAYNYVGGVVGAVINGGTVQNCAVGGSVNGDGRATGGLAGIIEDSTVQNCFVRGGVIGNGNGNTVGGIAGAVIQSGTVQNCIVTASISGYDVSGGVAGAVGGNSTMQNCITTASVSGGNFVGGVAGAVIQSGTVQACAALNPSVSATGDDKGRIVGKLDSSDLFGNYAWSGMTVDSHTISSADADSIDGADANASTIQTLWTNGPLNSWDSHWWTLAEGRLPVLTGLSGQSDALPSYITGLAGAGTSEDPYRIYTADDLKWLADRVNGGEVFNDKFFQLEKDIDLSAYGESYDGGNGWTPIGTFDNPFTGTFDGGGKTIIELYISQDDDDANYVGLFGRIDKGTVQNLTLKDVNIRGNKHIGGIAGYVYRVNIQNCAVSGNINGSGVIGGVVGRVYDVTMENCVFTGNISGDLDFIGGVVGYIYASGSVENGISNCISTGSVSGNDYIGGIAGYIYSGTIQSCAALNSSISATDSHTERVLGGGHGTSDNYAWSGMKINGSPLSDMDANSRNGADADANTVQTLWTVGGLNTWDSSVWTLAEGKLPVLTGLSGQSDALPSYITGLDGAGTSEDPYRIHTATDLKWLADQVNSGNNYFEKFFRLEKDIDLSAYGESYDESKGWTPIGRGSNHFQGTFDGNSKSITGLYINRNDVVHVGLFGIVNGSMIQNLALMDVSISGSDSYVGGVAGGIYADSVVQNCAVRGSISGGGNSFIGGVTGGVFDNSTVQDCVVTGSVSGSGLYIGGVAGYVFGTVQSCIVTASVSGNDYVGGVAGQAFSSGTVQSCAALNQFISATSSNFGRVTGKTFLSLSGNGNIAFIDMKVNGGTVSGSANDENGADVNTAQLLRTSIWQNTLGFDGTVWNKAGGRLPYLRDFPEYAPRLDLTAYTFPKSDSSDINLIAEPTLLMKSSTAQTVTLTATGNFKDTAWPDLAWETSEGSLDTSTNTFSSVLTVPAEFSGTITVTAKPASFPSLLGKGVTIPVNGDLEGTVTLDGTFRYGQTLTAMPSITSTSPGALSYQWMRGSDPISGATGTAYGLTRDDIGELVSVRVTAQNYTDQVQSEGQRILRAINSHIPAAPQLSSTTSASITLESVTGYEYAILPSNSDTEQLGLEDAFQPENTFTGLTAETSYDLYQRMAGTATTETSPFSEKLTVTTDSPLVTSVTVKTAPTKTIYTAGEPLNLSGLVLTLSKDNGSTENVVLADFSAKDITVSPQNGMTLATGHTKVTITHMASGKTATLIITVTAKNTQTGSSYDDDSTNVTTIVPERKPHQPVTAATSITATARSKDSASTDIPDQTITDAIAKAKAEAKTQGKIANGIAVELTITMPKDATSLTAMLTRNSLNSLISSGVKNLTINGSLVTISFDQNALEEIQNQSSGDVIITITSKENLSVAAQKMIGKRPVYNITMGYGNGKPVSSLGEGTVTVYIPYRIGKNEVVGGLYAVYVDDKGNATPIPGSAYDANSRRVIFTTTHFSLYGVGYTPPSAKFTDISTHWGKESIEYVVDRGILSGTSETTFSPDTAMTRGMLVRALGRLAGIDTQLYITSSFIDVKTNSTFCPYIQWAYEKGIVQGIGNSQFAPDRSVTREEIAVIISNYAKATDYKLPVTREAITFSDNSYGTAIRAVQQAGIMKGGTGNKFSPKANATRAEVSAMLHHYIKLTMDSATAQGWAVNHAGQYLHYKNGKALTGTQTIDGTKYFFNLDGTLKIGWVKEGNNWHYYLGNKMLTGWQHIGSGNTKKTYYFDTYGRMLSGQWFQIDDEWYYFYVNGSLAEKHHH